MWYNSFTMNIKHKPQFNIEKVTAHYTKKDGVPVHYVCTSDIDESDKVLDIYYRDTPHPEYNNYYFGLYADEDDRMMICKADTIEILKGFEQWADPGLDSRWLQISHGGRGSNA